MPINNNNQDLRKLKTRLREEYRAKRLQMSIEEKQDLDRQIHQKLKKLFQYRYNDTILIYVSKSIEVDTYQLIEAAWRDGKRVAVPKCIDGTRKMIFYYINSVQDLEKATFGVYEPKVDICMPLRNMSSGLCIVPGMAFDTDGYRLGYGKGYYDRFLSGFKGDVVGICYSNCIQWKLPHGQYDRRVDAIVTDKFIRNTGEKRSMYNLNIRKE